MPSQTPIIISSVVEGLTDEAVIRRVLCSVGIILGPVFGKNGKHWVRKHIHAYNQAAVHHPWFVVVDLDADVDCAPMLVRNWLPAPSIHMLLRVAVREVEAWLLADRKHMARFLGVSEADVPANPDSLNDPKGTIVELARRSRQRNIRMDIVPRQSSGRAVGPAYASRMIEYATGLWRPDVAAGNSDSLARCMRRLREIGAVSPANKQ